MSDLHERLLEKINNQQAMLRGLLDQMKAAEADGKCGMSRRKPPHIVCLLEANHPTGHSWEKDA